MSSSSFISNPFKTILTITVGFAIIYLITEIPIFLWIGIGVGILGLISGFLARWIEKLWMLLGKGLGYVVPNILMTLLFYFFLFPIALLSKAFGKKDPLRLKKNQQSTFIDHVRTFSPEDFEHTF